MSDHNSRSRISIQIQQPVQSINKNTSTTDPSQTKVLSRLTLTDHRVHNASRLNKKDTLRIFISLICAVLTGVTLGLLFLSNVQTDLADKKSHAALPASSNPAMKVSNKKFILPSLNAFVLQYGVFSNRQNVMKAQLELRRTYPDIRAFSYQAGDKYSLFLGLFENRKEAMNTLNKVGVPSSKVMIKDLSLPTVTFHTHAPIEIAELKALEAARILVGNMLQPTTAEMILDKHKEWTKQIHEWRILNENLTLSRKSMFSEEMIQSLNASFFAWTENRKHPHMEHQNNMQKQILSYIEKETLFLNKTQIKNP